jgi:hypothetical protein
MFVLHLIFNTGHAYGNITNILKVLKIQKNEIWMHWRNTMYIKRVRMDYK